MRSLNLFLPRAPFWHVVEFHATFFISIPIFYYVPYRARPFSHFFVFISVVFPELLCPVATSIPRVISIIGDISQNNGTKLAYLTDLFGGVTIQRISVICYSFLITLKALKICLSFQLSVPFYDLLTCLIRTEEYLFLLCSSHQHFK